MCSVAALHGLLLRPCDRARRAAGAMGRAHSELDMRVPRLQLPSGVPGLDEILGGGIPEASCTVIGGAAGTGKTTLALQLAFANASDERPALFCSGGGEPPRKLQQHQEQLRFFDTQRVDHE